MDKDNKKYVEFGGGNKFLTFKIWYKSEILKQESFIKVQINFVEDIKFKVSKKNMGCLLDAKNDKELEVLYGGNFTDYTTDVTLYTYDIKEILCEKVRAILTRRGVKARDFVDVFLITLKFDLKVQDLQKEIIEKIEFMVGMYHKYQENLDEKIKLLDSNDLFEWGTEKELLLEDIPEKQFNRFINEFQGLLKGIIMRL